jgi:hypothetical protein
MRRGPDNSVGRTPWSARVPLDPPLRRGIKLGAAPPRPTGASAADQGVRPTPKPSELVR